MQLWAEMFDYGKTGFNYGHDIPAEAGALRLVYIRIVNTLLERFCSKWRVIAYNWGDSDAESDCNTLHILKVPLSFYVEWYVEKDFDAADGKVGADRTPYILDKWQEDQPDNAWVAALTNAHKMNCDAPVTITVDFNLAMHRTQLEFAEKGDLSLLP